MGGEQRAFISGGTGFVGVNLANLLIKRGYGVTVMGHTGSRPPGLDPHVRVVSGDGRVPGAWQDIQPPILHRDVLITDAGQMYDPQTGARLPQRLWRGMNTNWTRGGARGCGRAVACDHLVTVRDAHASYFDLATGRQVFFRGVRSGCTNSLIPAGGILNAPNFARGCSCNYAVFASLALTAFQAG